VRQQDDYQLSKEEIVSSGANREAGQTQQKQVTETIVRDMPKINRNDNVTIQNVANGQTQEMKYKSREPNRFRTMGNVTLLFYIPKTPLRK
jgi:preprotein translocase subunit SecA